MVYVRSRQVGNYTLQFFFAGDYYPKGYYVNGIINNTATTGGYNATQDCLLCTFKYNQIYLSRATGSSGKLASISTPDRLLD